MIELIPFEETVAGKELINIGIEKGIIKGFLGGFEKGKEEGRKEGIDKGELIGKIRLAQSILKQRAFFKKKLEQKSLRELRVIFKEFEKQLEL